MADDLTIPVGVRTGGGASPNLGANAPPDRVAETVQTLQGFSKLAGSVLAPIIEREKNAAFVGGVTEVMRGRTADEIAREQPGWARIFGDNYAVQGARMQEAASVGTRFLSSVQAQMPELRKLSQEGFSRHVADAMEKNLPKDPQAAMMAKQRIIQSLPELTGQWSRANVQFQQEQALVQHTEAVGAAVGLLKTGEEAKRSNPAVVDPALDDAAWAKFEAAMTLPPGVDPKVHDQVLHRSLVGALGTPGGVALYAALKKRGMWDTLPQEVQDRGLTNARQLAGQMVRAGEVPEEMLVEAATLRARAVEHSPEELVKKMLDLNGRVSRVTGIPRELYTMFTGPEQEQVLKEREAKKLAEEVRQERKAENAANAEERRRLAAALRDLPRQLKLLEEYNNRQTGLAAFNLPSPGAAGEILGSLPAAARTFAVSEAVAGTDPKGLPVGSAEWQKAVGTRATLYTRMLGESSLPVPAAVRDSLRVPLSQATFGADVQTAIATAQAITDPATRAKVLGADGARLVETFNALYQGAMTPDPKTGRLMPPKDPQALWTAARARAERPPQITGGDEGKALAAELSKMAGFADGALGAEMKDAYDRAPPMPEEARKRFAIASVQHKAYPAGPLTVLREGRESTSPEEGFGGATGLVSLAQQAKTLPALAQAMGSKLKATGQPTVIRGADQGGLARFVFVYDTAQGPQYLTVTGEDVRKAVEAEYAPQRVLSRQAQRWGRIPN